MKKYMKKIICTLALISFSSVAVSGTAIDSTSYGEKWPFTVEKGVVACLKNNSVIFIANKKEYALNGTASSQGYQPIEPIWKYDVEFLAYQKQTAISEGKSLEDIQKEMGGTPRINIGDVLTIGLKLCD